MHWLEKLSHSSREKVPSVPVSAVSVLTEDMQEFVFISTSGCTPQTME